MAEAENLHFRLGFSRTFGLCHLLGAAYTAGQLSLTQSDILGLLDRQLLAQAAALEIVYGSTLRHWVRDLFTWRIPLAAQTSTLHIEITPAALACKVDEAIALYRQVRDLDPQFFSGDPQIIVPALAKQNGCR